jgi:glycosyltransferase involved in cell wall biosynthesis
MSIQLAVLITYYNERELLRECLESLFANSRLPDEVIVYDDASRFPAQDYVPDGLPVRVIRGETNHGPSYGRNVLVEASTAEFVHSHDTDDLFDSQWCARVKASTAESGADAIFTEISSYREGKMVCERVIGLNRLTVDPDLIGFCIDGVMLPSAGTYRRAAVLAIGGYREDMWQSEDFDFHIRLAASGIRFAVVTSPSVNMRLRQDSRSTDRIDCAVCLVAAVRRLWKQLPARYHQNFAERVAGVGVGLLQMGESSQARAAFELAYEIGRPRFVGQRRLFRMIAAVAGPEAAENVASAYRRWIPASTRRAIAYRS